ncbi:MAG: hypothetical protein HY301_02150 [Verrucomicrobia bacterium]|nr:hypothetical protein [Verrucomicrobiota bacterium]
MNIAELQKKLITAARKDAPTDRVPYAFEKRIMAALKSSPVADAWSLWGGALLKAAAPCVAIMLALGVWAACVSPTNGSDLTLEDTVLAAVTPPVDME